MRRILVLISFFITLGLSAAGVIQVSPASPQAGQPVTFTLTGVSPILSVSWSFGDDSSASGITATHTYATARKYHVWANFTLTSSAGVADTWVTVAPPFSRGPNAPFNITSLILRWKDGQSSVTVPKGTESLVAYADIKFEGTGSFQAQWLVDGQVLKTVTQPMSFAGKTTIDSGTTPALPTSIPGSHDVTLRILSPAVNFRLPVIRYVVTLEAPQPPPPAVESVNPPSVYAGEEVELQIKGQNLTQEMKLDFGSGITFLGPIEVMSPMSAKVKVFVPPTAKTGFHSLALVHGKNRLMSKAQLEVKTRKGSLKVLSGAMPCPDQQTFKKGIVELKTPTWRYELPDHAGFQNSVQTLTDFTVFQWAEPQKGAAEYFELRIYDKSGQKLLLTQRLPGNTQQWDTSAGFVPKLVDLFKAQKASGTVNTQTQPNGTTTPVKTGGQQKAQTAGEIAADADVLWQIVGLRDYTCLPKQDEAAPAAQAKVLHGSAPSPLVRVSTLKQPETKSLMNKIVPTQEPSDQGTQEAGEAPKPVKMSLEVEASELWPLKLPNPATGITYGSCATKLPGMSLSAVKSSGGNDPNGHIGDPYMVSGSFNLAGSPYGFKPSKTQLAGPKTQNYTPEAIGCTFDNVFLDWGDGSPLVALSPDVKAAKESNLGQIGSDAVFSLPANKYTHSYQQLGKYNVKVFMLSEDDVQLAGLKSGAAQALASKGTGDTTFRKLVKVATGTTDAPQALPAGGSQGFVKLGGMQVANSDVPTLVFQKPQMAIDPILSRAYVLLCDSKDIRPYDDPCATKPLELVSLDLSFGGWPSVNQKVDAVTTACNEAFGVTTRVLYHGHGDVKVVWKVDGVPVAESTTTLTNKPRTDLTKAQAQNTDCSQAPTAEWPINLPEFLPTTKTGVFHLTAEATVVQPAAQIHINQVAEDLASLGKGGKVNAGSPAMNLLKASKSTPPKVGALNPNPMPGMPQVVYISDLLPALSKIVDLEPVKPLPGAKVVINPVDFKKPPHFVAAKEKTYRVDAPDPKDPCSLDFPTKNGSFRVTDLGSGNAKMVVVGGVTQISGQGKIKVAIRASEDTLDERLALPITLDKWEADGSQVTKGDVNLPKLVGQKITLPGTRGTLDSLTGKIQGKGKTEDMLAKLTLSPIDATLTLRGNENNVPVWSVEKPLSSEGDFYAEGLALPETFLGGTPWIMKSAAGVVLDYSHTQGDGPAGQGKEWVGVRLKQLVLKPFSFDLVGESAPFPPVDTWYLGKDAQKTDGLHGSVSFKNWEGKFQDGSIKVGSMNFDALGGQNYKATYADTEVQVPWFASPIKGNVTMSKTSTGFIWAYDNVKAASMPAVVNGGFSLKPANLYFTNEKNVAWTVMGDAILDFKADGKPFASFTLDRFCYRFDGRASFEQNNLSRILPLNKKSSLGDTPADLKDVVVTMPTSGASVVDFAFHTTLRLSESPLLPAADTVVRYQLNKSGQATYSAPLAVTAPFELALAFPMGSPTIQGKIRPVYAPGGSGTRYTGEVDLGLFGGPPIKAQFVLGYKGGKDYFLCRADVPLGPSGQVIVPELLTLYKIHGGLGYNFGLDAFQDTVSILNVQPDMKGNALFSAGMRVGSSDSFIYMMDGTLTISTAVAARMDFDAWLLTANHGGQGQFKGYYQYGNGSFDGRMWGGLNLLGGLVQFTMGDSATNAAVDLHLGSDSWHIYAGQRNGARLKAKVITDGSDAYLMLGSKEGLAVGGSQSYDFEVGDSSVASAYARAYLDVGLQITPQPKIIGDFGAGMSAGVCVFGVCVDGGADAAVHAEALPLKMGATCTLDLGWYLGGDYSFHVNM